MRSYLLTLFAVLSTLFAFSQAPAWAWAREAYTSNTEFANDVAVDPTNGDIVVVGEFTGDISAFYGADFIAAVGGGFVAKYNSSGILLWAFRIGGNDDDRCKGVAIDQSGNIYVTGFIKNIADFRGTTAGSFILSSVGGADVFIAKYNSAGQYQWAKRGGGTSDDEGLAICVNSNQVFVSGYYKNVATFGLLTTHSLENHDDVLVVAYDLNGNEQWIADAGATSDGYGYDIVADNAQVYVVGDYKGTLSIYNSGGILSDTHISPGNWDCFALCYSTTGNFIHSTKISSGNEEHCNSIIEKNTKLYITGSIKNTCNFSGYISNPVLGLGGNKDFFVAELNKSDGVTNWVNCEAGANDQEGMQLSTDGNNNILVSGYFDNDITFASGPTLSSNGNTDIFVTNYTTTGAFVWAQQAGGIDHDVPYGIASVFPNEVYVVGEYKDAAIFGSTTLFNESSVNIFVAKLDCSPILNNTIAAIQTICAGSTPTPLTGTLPTGGSTPYIYLWEQSLNNISWSPASGTNNLQNYSPPALLASTYYRRTVTSTGGCSNSSVSTSILITVNANPSPALAGNDTTICSSTVNLNGNIVSIGTGLWTVIAGTGTFANATLPNTSVTGLSVGINTFRWTTSNGVCASTFDEVNIIQDANPTTAFAGNDTTVCSSTINLNGNILSVGTGLWTVIAGIGTFANATLPNTSVSGLSVGINTFRWTTANGVCSSTFDEVDITLNANPTTAYAGNDTTICSSTVILNGNIPSVGIGMWTLISGTGTISSSTWAHSVLTNLGIGPNVFRWTITNGVCVSTFDEVTIFVDDVPTIALAGNDTTICSSSIILNGNTLSVGTGLWTVVAGTGTFANATLPNTSVNGLSLGTNTFRWTTSNGVCSSTFDDVDIIQDPNPTTAFAGNDTIICSTSINLNGNILSVGTGLWTVIAGTGTFINATLPNTSVSGLSVGINTFRWTTSNGVCISTFDDVNIIQDPNPTTAFAGNDTTVCSSSINLNGNILSVGTGMWTLIAGTGTFANATLPNTSVSGLSVGINTFRWTSSNGVCASTFDDVNIILQPSPTIAAAGNDSSICSSTFTLGGNVALVGVGNWTVTSGTGNFSNSNLPNSIVSGLSPGSNTFRWTISNSPCLNTYDEVTITLYDAPTTAYAGIDQPICSTTSVFFGNSPVLGNGIWTLISGSGNILNSSSEFSPVSGLGIGQNTFTWTISNGICPASVDTMTITVFDYPSIADAGVNITTLHHNQILNANTPVVGVGTWYVITGAGQFADIHDPNTIVSGLQNGQNLLRWEISNGNCIANYDEVLITINPLEVPNGFSPNTDGINDNFNIPNLEEFTNVKLNVFNRWGAIVYENSDYKNDWYGNNESGTPLSDDTYYYTLEIEGEYSLTGYIVIKRK